MRKKTLTPLQVLNIEHEVCMLLHTARDTMRNRDEDTTKITFPVNNPYYCEAFGIMRGLAVLGYGELKSGDDSRDLLEWFDWLQKKVLEEEHFESTNECDYCFLTYGKDAVRKRRIA
jgi:hypothetical protein